MGLLLGLYALSLLCWHTAARQYDRPRLVPLVGLAVAIVLAVTSHSFGVLILVPMSVAELARTVRRRRFDWPVMAALVAELASVAALLPFLKALLPYRQHYYTGAVNLHNISQGYREIFLRYNSFALLVQRVLGLVVATLALAITAFRVFRRCRCGRRLWTRRCGWGFG